jgi:hypothetical protein
MLNRTAILWLTVHTCYSLYFTLKHEDMPYSSLVRLIQHLNYFLGLFTLNSRNQILHWKSICNLN